jgi:hypothetical protein
MLSLFKICRGFVASTVLFVSVSSNSLYGGELSQNNSLNYPNILKNQYILRGSEIINPKANIKILDIGNEVFSKTGVSIYVYVVKTFNINSNITFQQKKEKIQNIKKTILRDNNISKSYAMIIYADTDKYVTIINSKNLDGRIDKDNILDDYIIPLIASFDKNSKSSKITAGIFNGYAEIADEVAKANNVELKTNISSDNKMISDIWRKVMYFLVISGIIAYLIADRRYKKLIKEHEENEKNKNTNKEESSKED